jgi:LysM repeat protein
MVLALIAVVLARLPESGASPAGAIESPSPSTVTLPSPTPRVTPRPSPRPTPTVTPEPTPTLTPSPSPTPELRTYRVVAGDTLIGIAGRYGTTVKAIMDLNGLTSTSLRIGQVLKIP